MRFSDEELSRILSAHCTGDLKRDGASWDVLDGLNPPTVVCVLQAAFTIDGYLEIPEPDNNSAEIKLTTWFDCNYEKSWTPDELLRKLEQHVKTS